MSQDRSREEFRAWHKKEVAALQRLGHLQLAREVLNNRALMYAVWQASRAAVVVELPPIGDYLDTYQQGENRDAYLVAIRDAIEAAGLKVAP